MRCDCGGPSYETCCGPLHAGGTAGTPEALMRSRYTAFARGLVPYLLHSWHSETRPRRLVLDPEQEWVGLTVLSSSGGLFDSEGVVEFRATWRHRGVTDAMQERSRFVREDGRWVYHGALPRPSSS